MFKNNLKCVSVVKLQIIFAMLVLGAILAESAYAQAAEKPQPTEAEYQTQYDDAIKLADMLRTSPVLLHNKLYTAEQEVELQALVDDVCSGAESDRDKAEALVTHIRKSMEPGLCYGLNAWDTLCDGDTEMALKSGLTTDTTDIINVPKKQADKETYCYTFYDVCRLADIPCFILGDRQGGTDLSNQYICMVYIENQSGTGKEWYFVDVMADDGQLTSRADVYNVMGSGFFPMDILLEYEDTWMFMNVIFLNKETMVPFSSSHESALSPYLAYDRTTGTVKAYFANGVLGNGDQYYRTEAYIAEDGEAPSGWIETKEYSGGEVNTYESYAAYGVFLRGRIQVDGTEYDLQTEFNSWIPYHGEAKSEPESEEHKAFASAYRQKLKDKSVKIAEALLENENYIWDDINFSEEDEAFLRKAVEEALAWENIDTPGHRLAFEHVGISLDDEDPDNLSEKAKAQAIFCYIRANVEPVDHGPLFVDSIDVLKSGEATCDGMSLLCRDMCVMAGIPCFKVLCAREMNYGDSFFVDHGGNLIKADGEWLFCDLMSSDLIGNGFRGHYAAAFAEEYDTGFNTKVIWLDHEMVRKNYYDKWPGGLNKLTYYEFDSEGKLGIYEKDRFGNPVVYTSSSSSRLWGDYLAQDENGKYLMEYGLHTVDVEETNEDGTALVVSRYAYYYQSGRLLLGKQVIGGTEYDFGDVGEKYGGYHKVKELSRRYVLSRLTFQPIEDQPYKKDGVCPVPEIYHGDKKLELGKDFKIVEYMKNTDITSYADASYKVEGIGDYVGSAIRYFKIVPIDISDMDVRLSQTSYTWSPEKSQYKPEVDFDMDLTGMDYDVRYYDCDKIGRARAVLTGKGHYTGSVTRYYDIAPCTWNEKDFKILDRYRELLQSQEFSYRFRPVTPEAKLFWFDEKGNSYGLTEGVDYDISYRDTDKPGIATVTATAKGNYQGSVTCTYKINKYDIGDNDGVRNLMAMGTAGNGGVRVIYTGSPVLPAIRDFDGLKEGVHYTMTVTDNVNVGTAKITLKGIGECTGTYEKKFQITPYVLSQNAITAEYTYTTYNGKVQKPLVTLKGNLVEGRDYFISYEKEVDGEYKEVEPKEVGKYRIAVRVTDNVRISQAGASDEDALDCYYISYDINGGGTGGSGTGGGTGTTGGGNTGTGGGNGSVVAGSGNTGDGSESGAADNRPGSGSTGGSGAEDDGTDDSGITAEETDGADKDVAASEDGKDDGSEAKEKEIITSDSVYRIKKLKASPKKNGIKIKWSKVRKAKGYQIQISLYKNYRKARTVTVKKSKTSYTLKKLKKNKKYYIRIRAYKGTTGKGKDKRKVYGKWKTVTKKTKKR